MFILLTIIILPLIGFIFSLLGGQFLGRNGAVFITIYCTFLVFIKCLILFFFNVFYHNQYYVTCFTWINSGVFYCNWGFLFDSLTIVMLIVVVTISLLVHIYSSSYMKQDPHLPRFMSYLSLFTFFMIILVTSDNFIQMFLGWEGVGFCSYLLINFWFTRLQANKAAIKAMLINRISDFALILGILTIFINFKSVEYCSVFPCVMYLKIYCFDFLGIEVNVIDTICLLLLIGAMGKSAQIFLHTWLPDAMEGPTPVSALIHAATMVTAGIFLIARCSPLFEFSPLTLKITVIVGAITAFFAGTVGLVQNDLKKIIAYSTCSQLGYMFFSCGLSNYNISVFHLFNHSFFKALLFLSAGAVIHSLNDEQDIRRMGGLRRVLPFTYIMFIIGSLSLMGFPFLTGFYSKDVILETAFACFNNVSHFAYWLGTFTALCTSFYSTRLIYLVFLNKTNCFKSSMINAHESSFLMCLPLALLAFGSIFIGYLFKDMFIGLGTPFWKNSIFIHPNNIATIDAEFLPIIIKILPLIFSFIGVILVIFLYIFNVNLFYLLKISQIGIFFYNFLNKKWFFDKIYNEYFVQKILNISYFKTYKLIDKGVLEILGPKGLVDLTYHIVNYCLKIQTGSIHNYLFFMILSIILLLEVITCQNIFLFLKLSVFFFLFFLF